MPSENYNLGWQNLNAPKASQYILISQENVINKNWINLDSFFKIFFRQ